MANMLSDSDWDSYSDTSDSMGDQYELESTYGGHAQSILSSLEETIGKIDDFLAFERGFAHGDVVCSSMDPSGQRGQIVDVDITVDLESLSGEVIKEASSKMLMRFRSFSLGDYVIYGPWLGKVVNVIDHITVLFDDGIKCEIRAEDPGLLEPVFPSLIEDAPYPFYPGQRVCLKHSIIFSCGPWKAIREGVVCHVEVGSVYVNWITSLLGGHTHKMPTPSTLQNPRNLTLLSYFSYSNWQLGDWCFFPANGYQHDQVLVEDKMSETTFPQGPTAMLHEKNSICDKIYVVSKVKTEVDVIWQDGSFSFHLDSQALTPVNNVGENDFWPGQFVMQKGTSDNTIELMFQRVGFVKSADAKEQTVRVKWLETMDSKDHSEEEILSAYELVEHPEYSFAVGDVILQKTICGDTKSTNMNIVSCPLLGEKDVHKGTDSEKYSHAYLSCIGTVIGLTDGGVQVKWASGFSSKVSPSEVVGVDTFEDQFSASEAYAEQHVEGVASGGMLDQPMQECAKIENGMQEEQVSGFGACNNKDLWDVTASSLPRAAFGFLRSVATSLFGSSSSTLTQGFTMITCLNNSSESSLTCDQISHEQDGSEMVKMSSLRLPVDDSREKLELCTEDDNMKVGKFKQFDIVFDFSDHHFAESVNKELIMSQVNRAWLRKVHQEWSILEKNLPDSIYVRVSEERMDLMRAAIVGAPGTPYHDGLFLFDISLPQDYPNKPPMVHYNSGGLRLNPNLYESGKVCLSLLNTWTGSGSEVWSPENSSVLQVLLSLQALVLNEKPYFNEAGYDKHIGGVEGEKNSTAYNENAFLLSCKSMLYLLQNPPKRFEALVKDHFARHSHSFLLACKAYMNGARVGCALNENQPTGDVRNSSTGFRIMLAKLFPMLVSAFALKGIDCHQITD